MYIPLLKSNQKKEYKANVVRIDKVKRLVDEIQITKPMFRPFLRLHRQYEFAPTCHHCSHVGHIIPKCAI